MLNIRGRQSDNLFCKLFLWLHNINLTRSFNVQCIDTLALLTFASSSFLLENWPALIGVTSTCSAGKCRGTNLCRVGIVKRKASLSPIVFHLKAGLPSPAITPLFGGGRGTFAPQRVPAVWR